MLLCSVQSAQLHMVTLLTSPRGNHTQSVSFIGTIFQQRPRGGHRTSQSPEPPTLPENWTPGTPWPESWPGSQSRLPDGKVPFSGLSVKVGQSHFQAGCLPCREPGYISWMITFAQWDAGFTFPAKLQFVLTFWSCGFDKCIYFNQKLVR